MKKKIFVLAVGFNLVGFAFGVCACANSKVSDAKKSEAELSYFDPALPKSKWPIEEAIAHRKKNTRTPYVLKKVPIVDLEKETKPLREFFFEGKSLDEILQKEIRLGSGIKAFVPVGSREHHIDTCLEYPLSSCYQIVVSKNEISSDRGFVCFIKTTKSGFMGHFKDAKETAGIWPGFAWWRERGDADFAVRLIEGHTIVAHAMAKGSPRDFKVDCDFYNPSGVMNGPETDPAIAFTKAILERMVKSNPSNFRTEEKK